MIKLACELLFRLRGWRYENRLLETPRACVMVGAPHTSNWDFVPAMVVARRVKHAKFVIKHEWLRFPLGLVMRPIGAIGVDREKIKQGEQRSSTDLMAQLFQQHADLMLMIAPEGTRKANSAWKSGFWHIAQKAGVPIVLAFADYQKKVAGLGLVLVPGDFEEDMRTIMAFYAQIRAHAPEKFALDARYTGPR